MSEIGELFSGWKELSQQKRASNRVSSAALLTSAGIPFESKNNGAHLVVQVGQAIADFWPGTGLWSIRGTGKQSRGVRKLISALKRTAPVAQEGAR